MIQESAVRQCIKCCRVLPVGRFDDSRFHQINICKECKKYYAQHGEYLYPTNPEVVRRNRILARERTNLKTKKRNLK